MAERNHYDPPVDECDGCGAPIYDEGADHLCAACWEAIWDGEEDWHGNENDDDDP